ncbi:MAG: hypothetical protein ACK2TV_15130 [Anaerolineales bacterium]
MDKSTLEKVCTKIYHRFPSMRGKKPSVSKQTEDRYLLLFSGSHQTPDGKTIQQTLRVVTSEDGRILKTSMSR